MNALAKFTEVRSLTSIVDLLKILAESSAASWALFPLELADVVDPLQAFVERTKLVHTIGQDAVQRILFQAFEPYRQVAGCSEPETISLPPEPEPRKRAYRTPQATVDAFFYVARTESAEYLAGWLERHPLDVPELRKLWKQKCIAR